MEIAFLEMLTTDVVVLGLNGGVFFRRSEIGTTNMRLKAIPTAAAWECRA
jgi:hypothetical protein